MRSSFALYCLNHLSIVNTTSSCGWPSILSSRFFRTRSASCSLRFRAFALIQIIEFDVVFPSIFVKSLILDFIEDGSSCATHSFVFFYRNCSFSWKVCPSVLSSPSACVKKNCSSSATTEEDVVNSMGVVWTTSRIWRLIFSTTFHSNLEGNSAAVLTEPAISAISMLNCGS